MFKRAVILAGGQGKRLKPYTVVLPKPLVPIDQYPILEIVIRQLVKHGFTHITMAVNHMAEIIKAFFGDGSRWKVKIDYSMEDKPLSTMGPLKLIGNLPENFLVMNGDILTTLNYAEFYDFHCNQNSVFTIAATQRVHEMEYGVLEVDEFSRLSGFNEKPSVKYNVSMGIYMANRSILEHIPLNTPYGFDNLMYDFLKYKKTVNILPFDGLWFDIGRPDDYFQAAEAFSGIKNEILGE
ncbi:MAG: NTP transferase domain-containing protein [Nitrospirae bacterium]|nr:NTP transferase domain-containing protein [Nitrospirota bacterium]